VKWGSSCRGCAVKNGAKDTARLDVSQHRQQHCLSAGYNGCVLHSIPLPSERRRCFIVEQEKEGSPDTYNRYRTDRIMDVM
jgi:hypothetical protein